MGKQYKFFEYGLFLSCDESYPYLEHSDFKTKLCKEEIKQWLKIFVRRMNDIGLVRIFDFTSHQDIPLDELCDDVFLFYSYENGVEAKEYLIAGAGEKYNSVVDWCNNDSDSLLIFNDHDGIGFGFAGGEKIFKEIDNLQISLWNKVDQEEFICWKD